MKSLYSEAYKCCIVVMVIISDVYIVDNVHDAENRALTLERIKCAYFGIQWVIRFENTDLVYSKNLFQHNNGSMKVFE